MAEIKLQEKKKPIWPWIIGLIIVALLIWALVSHFNNDDNEVVTQESPVAADTTNDAMLDNSAVTNEAGSGAISGYIAWANNDNNAEMGREHDYTANGIKQLSRAIEELANRKFTGDVEVQNEVDEMKSSASQIQEDWKSGDHANEIKAAFLTCVDAIEKIQQKTDQGLKDQVDELRQKANSVDKQTLTLGQKGDIKDFFRKAASVLEKMNNA